MEDYGIMLGSSTVYQRGRRSFSLLPAFCYGIPTGMVFPYQAYSCLVRFLIQKSALAQIPVYQSGFLPS